MAEYKRTWGNRFKAWRQRESLTKAEFAEEVLGQQNVKKYKAIEEGRAAPSAHQKFLYWEGQK